VNLSSLKSQFAAEFIDIQEASQIEGARWEAYQFRDLNNRTRYGLDVKSRQVGWSFTAALDAFCDSRLNPGWPYIFVSINLDEAKEKIRYLRNIVAATDSPARPQRFLVDSMTELEFEDHSRFISHPCKPVRGKAGARVYLDEMAHYPEGLDKEIYTAAVPATTKGGGYIRIGSSPLGARGLFWEIATQSMRQWPGFTRTWIPWWVTNSLSLDAKLAAIEAPLMTSEERVEKFGTDILKEIFGNMFLEDFQQEYECMWVDETTSWIPWDVIIRNQKPNLLCFKYKTVSEVMSGIDDIREAIAQNQIEGALCGGLDIGRKHDLTEFVAVGKSSAGDSPLRLSISLDRVEYDEQEACFTNLIEALPFTDVLIDRNGIGAQLAEALERTWKANGVDFTNASKELWAVNARIAMQRNQTPIPEDRDLSYQIHSIKKQVTAAKNNVFDTERNAKHHADKFWAWALALYAANSDSSTGEFAAGVAEEYRG
jgi:phage FluMu gp28-like protein